ncbi:MAG: hypothetical protein ABW212_14155 [Pseudonocardia sediminis]
MTASPGTCRSGPVTPHQRIVGTLVDDPVLATLGFDHRTIGAEPPQGRPGLRVGWSGDWSLAASGMAGTLTVEPTGVTAGTRAVVLERVGTALAQAHRAGGPVQVRRSGGSSFLVLTPAEGSRTPVSAAAPVVRR